MKQRLLLVLILSLGLVPTLRAEGWVLSTWHAVKQWVDSADIARADRSYVRLADQGFVGYVRTSFDGTAARLHFPTSSVTGLEAGQTAQLASRPSQLVAVGLAYRGWGLSWSHDFARHGDSDFTYTFYSRRYGLEYHYHDAYTLSGDLKPENGAPALHLPLDDGRGRLRTTQFNAYWVFDHNRFSHPAAMLYTTYQLRSCGSWLALANYWHASYRDYRQTLPFERLSLSHIGVGGGYARHTVFARGRFLLHTSLMSSLNVWHRHRLYAAGAGRSLGQDPSVDVLGHLHLVYNFGRCILSQQNLLTYSYQPLHADAFTAHTLDWSSRLVFGIRF